MFTPHLCSPVSGKGRSSSKLSLPSYPDHLFFALDRSRQFIILPQADTAGKLVHLETT